MAAIFDGCLADFNSSYISLVKEVSGRDLFPESPFDIPCWSYPEFYGYTTKEVSKAWKVIQEDGDFWWKLKRLPGAVDFLKDLKKLEQEVHFITSRPGINVKEQTEDWLQFSGFHKPSVFISSEKGKMCRDLNIDFYLDDKDENCQDVVKVSPTTECYMLAQSWNHSLDGVPRLGSLKSFLEILTVRRVFKGE